MSRCVRTTVAMAVAALVLGAGTSTTTSPAVLAVHEFDPVPDTPAPASLAVPAAATAADTFALHSDPGAPYTIYLDFSGYKLLGTLWNTLQSILMPILNVPAWDPDGNGATFAPDELSRIHEIWERVAADYAPFNVDVTTEDPGSAALIKSGTTDHAYGVRALILGSDSASQAVYAKVCNSACGGIAFQPSFGSTDLTPALIFASALGPNDPTYVADAASHEIGHTLGLSHDGLYPSGSSSHQEYYPGKSGWGPLMGDPYAMPLSQWSNGNYANASNTEDDVTIIKNILGLRPDESGDGPSAAVPLGDGNGFITSRGDVDTYALGQCSGTVQIAASPSAIGTDLDIDLQLLNAAGDVLAESDPVMKVMSWSSASGLDATISTSVPSGAYYVRIDGGGAPANNPYDDYGSLGAYQISASGGCSPTVAEGAPSAPLSVVATPTTTSALTLSWRPPVDAAGSAVTGYQISLGGTTLDVGVSIRSHVFSGLSRDTSYVATVAAVNAAGVGVPSGAAARTAASTAVRPSRVTSLAASWHSGGRYLRVGWGAPTYNGGTAVLRYRINVDGRALGTVSAKHTAVLVRNLRRGRHVIKVRAVNAVGASAVVRRVVRVPRH